MRYQKIINEYQRNYDVIMSKLLLRKINAIGNK